MAATRDISVRVRVIGDKEYRAAMKRISAATGNLWKDTAMGNIASAALQKVMTKLADTIKAGVKASIDFETALANVAKTTGMNETELKYFGEEMKALSTQIPITAVELLGLAEAAGQLGIADKDIQEFTEVMAALGVSTNMTSEQAADSLARIANIMGTSASEYERMGSTIVELGNNSAATESEIVEMSTRIAGAAKLAGMSEANIFALATALASVGIEADAGGGSLSTLISNITVAAATGSKDLIAFADVAGMTAAEFKSAWETDPAAAFTAWIEGLAKMEANGESALVTLDNLGIKQIRQRRAITSLVGAENVLGETMEMSNRAWEENIALTEEAEKRYATSESQLEMYQNKLTNLNMVIGDRFKGIAVGAAQDLGKYVEELTEFLDGKESLDKMIADIDESYAAKSRGIKDTETYVRTLIKAMEDLGNVESMDNVTFREFMAYAEQIKMLAPEVAKNIDFMTGEIEGGYEALYKAAEQNTENAFVALDVQKAEEQVSAYEIAMKQYELASANAALALGRLNAARAEESKLTERQNEMIAEATAMAEQYASEGMIISPGDLLARNKEYRQLEDELVSAKDSAHEASAEFEKWNEQAIGYATEMREFGIEVDATFSGLGETVAESASQFNALERNAIRTAEAAIIATDDLIAKYEEAREAAKESLNGMFSGFDAIITQNPEKTTMETMMAGLQSKIDYATEYTQLLNEARQMGIDKDILSQLSGGDTQSFAYLQAVVKDGGENLDELTAMYKEVERLKTEMASSMAAAQVGLDEKALEIETTLTTLVDEMNQNPTAYANAASTVQGAIDGFNSKIPSLSDVVNRITRMVRAAANAANAAKSYTGTWSGSGSASYTPHAAGLEYVPFDNYPAMLHRGEMVLTALQAKAYRAEQFANYGMIAALERAGSTTTNNTSDGRTYNTRNNNNYRFGDVYVREERDIRRLTEEISDRNRRKARGRGVR